jgi:excisionase family DNA binding protein
MAHKLPDVFSTHSAAKFCRVTPMTIIRWIDEGRIRAYKTPGGHRRIMRGDLEEFCRKAGIPMQWEDRVHAGTRRILIIDDDPTVVDAILDALLDEGDPEAANAFEVERTDNAFNGGRLLAAFRPDVIFVDLDLPGVDATMVGETVREEPTTTKSRLVGVSRPGIRTLPPKFDALLSRPFARTEVRQATGPLPKLPPR